MFKDTIWYPTNFQLAGIAPNEGNLMPIANWIALPWKLKAGFIAGFYELSYLILIDSGLNDFSVPTKPKFPELMLEYVNEDAREWITNLVDVI